MLVRWIGVLIGAASLVVVCTGRAADPPRKRDCEAAGRRPSLAGCTDAAAHVKLQRTTEDAKPRAEQNAPGGARRPDIVAGPFRGPPPPLANRSKALLVDEIRKLETLLAKTRRQSPDRPLLVRRIAEDYSELAAIAERERITAEVQADAAARSAKQRKSRQGANGANAKRLRQDAHTLPLGGRALPID